MTRRIFLFREEEGYNYSEKINRIPSSALTSDEAKELMKKHLEDGADYSKYKKEDFFKLLKEEVSEDVRKEFIDTLFNKHGKKGDTFNFRLFKVSGDIRQENLYTALESVQNDRLDHLYPEIFGDQALTVTNVDENESKGVVDFATKTAVRDRDIEPEENVPIQIVRSEDGSVEHEYGPEYYVRAPSSDRFEVRVYTDKGIVAASNRSGTTKTLQESLSELVTVLGGTSDQND